MTSSAAERNTAIHEAGHAVAAFCLRQRVRSVSIVPKPGSVGHVIHMPIKFLNKEGQFIRTPSAISRAESRIVICYAGPLASRKFQPRSKWRDGGTTDFGAATLLMGSLQGPDDEYNTLYAKLLWRRAELLVDFRWSEINAVADALLEHRTLDWDALEAAIFSGLKKRQLGAKK